MNIGLDYDGVITEDLQIWWHFCKMMKDRGHKVYIITMRYPTEVVEDTTHHSFDSVVERIIYTRRHAKKPYVLGMGITIDVWIDDNPRAINESASQIWGVVYPEGMTTHTLKG